MGDELKRETYSTRLAGFLVLIMSSLGLGNIWRFPFLCAKYGGAAFVLVYLVAIIFIVAVGNQCEVCMGKYSRRGSMGAFTSIGRRPIWRICGIVVFCLNVIVMIYYNVILSWITRYFFTSFSGAVFKAESPQVYWDKFIDTPQVFLWLVIVNIIVFGVLYFGVNKGVEKAAAVIAPVLFIVMGVMVVFTINLPDVGKGLDYYLSPDWSYLVKFETWMQAIGQALWSGIFGWGIIMVLGSYMKKKEDIPVTITVASLVDGAISWLVGLAIIPACVVYGVALNTGSSMSFLVLPTMFQEMPYGQLFMILFFGSLSLAGIAASIGSIESIIAPVMEEWNISRKKAVPYVFLFWCLGGLPSALSKNVFDWVDGTVGTYEILLGGFFILFFVGWAWGADRVRRNVLNVGAKIPFGPWWNVAIKFVAPALIAFAGFGFCKEWLLPYVPGPLAWGIITVIVIFNLIVILDAIRHPIPDDFGDIPQGPVSTGKSNIKL